LKVSVNVKIAIKCFEISNVLNFFARLWVFELQTKPKTRKEKKNSGSLVWATIRKKIIPHTISKRNC